MTIDDDKEEKKRKYLEWFDDVSSSDTLDIADMQKKMSEIFGRSIPEGGVVRGGQFRFHPATGKINIQSRFDPASGKINIEGNINTYFNFEQEFRPEFRRFNPGPRLDNRPEIPDPDMKAKLANKDIRLHDDVWEFLEITGHPITFSWADRQPKDLNHPPRSTYDRTQGVTISYDAPQRFVNATLNPDQDGPTMEYTAHYESDDAMHFDRCNAGVLLHDPEASNQLIQKLVDRATKITNLWKCEDGRKMKPSEMETSHIENIVAKIHQDLGWRDEWLPIFEAELERRD